MASLAPAKEQSPLLPASQAKSADVYIPGWANSRDAALDVMVVSSLQQVLRKESSCRGRKCCSQDVLGQVDQVLLSL